MTHCLDPRALATEHAYALACRERDDLLQGEPLDLAGARVAELDGLIADYEAHRDGYDLAHVKRLLATSG